MLTVRSTIWDEMPRFVPKDLKVEVLLRKAGGYPEQCRQRARGYAAELEFGFARSIRDVPCCRTAREQLEYAQLQAAHLDHAKIADAA